MRAVLTIALCVGQAGFALADAPARSLIPPPRPGAVMAPAAPTARTAPVATEKPGDPVASFFKRLATAQPRQRPENPSAQARSQNAGMVTNRTTTPTTSPRPNARPKGLLAALRANNADGSRVGPTASMKGAVCGVPSIKGVQIKDIPGRIKGCGVSDPVKISSVAGVPLSQHPTIDCTTAKALDSWVKNGIIPAVGRKGGGVAKVNIVAHFACRTRNNRPGAKISEHGRGRAVDVSGVTLKNGETLTVLNDWRSSNAGIMKAMHASACGPFGTVLGPKSDRYHQDHFHVDTASYRSGPYCK
ncbi:MAG: extensin family protein [Maritimibacter sp.]